MKGFIIGAFNDNGTLQGYYTGATPIDNLNPEAATLLTDPIQARAALGNIQRVNATLEMRLVPVEMTVTVIEPTSSAV